MCLSRVMLAAGVPGDESPYFMPRHPVSNLTFSDGLCWNDNRKDTMLQNYLQSLTLLVHTFMSFHILV